MGKIPTALFCENENYEKCINNCSDEDYSACSKKFALRNESANGKIKRSTAVYILLIVSIVISVIIVYSANKI